MVEARRVTTLLAPGAGEVGGWTSLFGSLAIVGESDVLDVYASVGDESLVGVPEMVGSSAIQDCYFGAGVCSGGKDFGWARRDYLR